MSIKKTDRQKVYNKCEGFCAYCGKKITIKEMQVDHIRPKRNWEKCPNEKELDQIENLNPSCRRCNHYKRANSLEAFREYLVTIHNRLRNEYLFKVAEDYGVVQIKPFDGIFYFEKIESENSNE